MQDTHWSLRHLKHSFFFTVAASDTITIVILSHNETKYLFHIVTYTLVKWIIEIEKKVGQGLLCVFVDKLIGEVRNTSPQRSFTGRPH